MKTREPRRKVLIQARMRVGAAWSDACILNLSARGMLVQSGMAPRRGNYLEIRRGAHVVVARVVWAKEQRFGVQTQDPVRAEDLLQETDNSSMSARAIPAAGERRSAPRSAAVRHEANRVLGKALEFGSLVVFGGASAFLLLATIDELLGRPLGALEAALVAKPQG